MTNENPPSPPLSRWLRLPLWLGLLVFALIAVTAVLWRVTITRGHARVEKIREQQAARIARSPARRPSAIPAPGTADQPPSTPVPPPPPGIPVDGLPGIGLFFTDFEAAKNHWAEIQRFADALRGPPDSVTDFLAVLKKLGLPVPEGMTQPQAAAAFLDAAKGAIATLNELRTAVDKGPWDWRLGPGSSPEDQERFRRMVAAQSALRTSALLTKALIDARWLTGDAGSLFADAMLMQNLARRVDDGPTLLSMLSARSLRDSTGRIVSSDRVLTSLTEAELTQLTRSLGEFNTAAASARALAGERDRLAAWTPEDIRHLYDHQAVQAAGNSGFSWTAALSSLPRALWSDALIADNQAVITGDLDASLARFDPAGRRYHPPDDTEVSGADAIRRDGGLLNEWYFTIALQTAVPDLFGFGDRLSYDQATTDLAQLSAALELQRRTTGQYPDTLDAIATTLPNGLPHELITGAPYVYQKTPEGGYRLSVPPLPINKSGVEPPVIVRPPAPAPSGR